MDDPGHPWPLDKATPALGTVRDQLLAAYADPRRGYHDTRHLHEVLIRLDELAEHGAQFDAVPVQLAVWFHDGVYDGERDAEERSATWAEDALARHLPDAVVAEVARLVRLTETHDPDDADTNGCALSDADLGILAAPRERYDEYVTAVRREYAHLEESVFVAGRAAVLHRLVDKPYLFHTTHARERWESPARANLDRELAAMPSVAPDRSGPG